jgi:hypothetical protein
LGRNISTTLFYLRLTFFALTDHQIGILVANEKDAPLPLSCERAGTYNRAYSTEISMKTGKI